MQQLGTIAESINEEKELKSKLQKRNPKMLIVEDDLDVAALSKILIEKFSNFECESVSDAFEAFSSLYENNFDYLLVDINLPGINGIEMLKQIDLHVDKDPLFVEKTHYCKKVPVLFYSGYELTEELPPSLKHFEVIGFIKKDKLAKKLAENFAT